ncbi:MFS transporter [Solwaraspora sp. WMMB335]|uniref:MFS transporter n=1 Tax=Solwaraspora sp. WMMB335 TaxID=3404118 RepID=UPI003B94EE62
MPTPVAEPGARPDQPAGVRPGTVLAVVSAGVILSGVDLFIVNVALPPIGQDLRVHDLADLSWLLNAYTVVFAALLVPAGRLSDRTNVKAGFLLGVAVFTVASACCAVATSLPMLAAFRSVQAVGAALLTPTSLALLLAAYPPERRAAGVRLWTALGGMAAVFGPVLGGLLVQVSWRWVFIVNVPIGIAAIAAGLRLLPRPQGGGGRPDGLGTVMLIASVGAVTLALVQSAAWGWGSARVIGLLAGAAVVLALLLRRSARHPWPVVETRLLRVPGTAAALVSMLLFSTAFGAMILSLVLLAENTWGWSALHGGLAATPNAVLILPSAVLAGVLISRLAHGGAVAVALGCVLFSGGVAWWYLGVPEHPAYTPHLLGGLLLTGVGGGLAMPTLFGLATAGLPAHRFATGSGLVSMVRQIGLALGVAVLVAVLGSPTGRVAVDDLRRGWLTVAVLTLVAAVPVLTQLHSRRPENDGQEMPAK